MPDTQPDYKAITQRQQAAWSAGDFNELARGILPVAESLCDAVALRAGERVLDVATGSGNAALVAARRYCNVTGIDFVPALIERAKVRDAAEGTKIDFRVGDAQALDFPDASIDVVLSVFGCMFAPDKRLAAGELTRVCRPGGRIGLACWTPESFAGAFFNIIAKYVPPSPGIDPSVRWGTKPYIEQLFGDRIRSLRAERRTISQYFLSIDHSMEVFAANLGPLNRALGMLEPPQRDTLIKDLKEGIAQYNRATDGTLQLEGEYLEIVVVRA